jgi:hypothetical protein
MYLVCRFQVYEHSLCQRIVIVVVCIENATNCVTIVTNK